MRFLIRCGLPVLALLLATTSILGELGDEDLAKVKWLQASAYVIPKETATEGEGYILALHPYSVLQVPSVQLN